MVNLEIGWKEWPIVDIIPSGGMCLLNVVWLISAWDPIVKLVQGSIASAGRFLDPATTVSVLCAPGRGRWLRGQRATPSLRHTCLNEVIEMPSDLAASESLMPNLLFSVSRSTSTGELVGIASEEDLGMTCTDFLASISSCSSSPLVPQQEEKILISPQKTESAQVEGTVVEVVRKI